jgi:hypothetical protein
MSDDAFGLTIMVVDVDPSARGDATGDDQGRARIARRAFARWAVRVLHATFYAPGRIHFRTLRLATHRIAGVPTDSARVDLVLVNASGSLGSEAKYESAIMAVREARLWWPRAPLLAAAWPPQRSRRASGPAMEALLEAGATDYVIAKCEELAAHRLRLMLRAWCSDVATTDQHADARLIRNLITERLGEVADSQ